DKQGIWQEETALKRALDEDPPTSCRLKSEGSWLPAGLRNLGATCYLNSLLQYLFFNLDFRYCLLRTTCKSQVVAALQRVFALLAEGESRVVDPKDFVTAARVDALEQADATEFSALLLDWLQRELADGSGGDFVPTLFEGESSTIVQCSQDASHTSEKRESFMEIRAGLSPVAMALEAREAQEAAASGRKSNPKAKAKKALAHRTRDMPPIETATPFEFLRLAPFTFFLAFFCPAPCSALLSLKRLAQKPYCSIQNRLGTSCKIFQPTTASGSGLEATALRILKSWVR
ncbi:UBP26, partial [Symbiodinium necroappetens]